MVLFLEFLRLYGEENKMKKELIGLLICTLLITVAVAPGINALTINRFRANESEPVNNGGLIDNIKYRCRGPYLLEILLREHVFAVLFNNNNDEYIWVSFYVNVTDRNGNELFNSREVSPPFPIKPNSLNQWQTLEFKDFRNKGHLFGFFVVIFDLTVLDDGSNRKEVFHGFIFGISALFFNPENGEVID